MRGWEIYRRVASRLDTSVLCGNYPGARDRELEGVRFIHAGAASPYPWSRWTYARAATRALKRYDYDAAVLDFSAYTPIPVPAKRPVGMVVSQVTAFTARARWGRLAGAAVAGAERGLLRRGSLFSATSEWTASQLEQVVRPGSTVVVVGNGVPGELFEVERHERDYLLFLGRFDLFAKGLDTLLDGFARLARERPDLRLVLAGRGKDELRVKELSRRLKIDDRVEVRRNVGESERAGLLAGALLLVMPSRFEGFGMVAAEAMAAGVPVLAAGAGALPEVVGNGGLLVPPGDSAALARAAATLLDDPGRRRELGQLARRLARRYSWDSVAERHLDFVELVARGARTLPGQTGQAV